MGDRLGEEWYSSIFEPDGSIREEVHKSFKNVISRE